MGQAVFEGIEPILQKSFHLHRPFEETEELGKIRSLNRTECERLQTLPDGYTFGVSEYEAKRMTGNGWTVDAVCEFFKHLPKNIDLF